MADPAPSAPLPDRPERRVSPADQMAALTGEPVELLQPEDEEPAEDRDASTAPQIDDLGASNDTNSAETPVSPPAPSEPVSSAGPPPAPHVTPPDPTPPPGAKAQQGQTSPVAPSSLKAQDHPNEGSRSPQGAAPLNGAAMVAAALTGGLRRAEPPAPAAPAAVSNAAGFQRRPRTRALPPRSARHQKHPRQSPPAGGEGSRASVGADARRDRLGLHRSLGCAGRHDAQGCFPRRRAARQAWRLHRRPHASQARRGTDQGRLPGWDRCSCLAGGAGTAGDDRHPHEDPRRRQRQWRHRACPFRNAPRRGVRGSAQGVQPRPLSRRRLRRGLREGDRRAFELCRDPGRNDLSVPSAR